MIPYSYDWAGESRICFVESVRKLASKLGYILRREELFGWHLFIGPKAKSARMHFERIADAADWLDKQLDRECSASEEGHESSW